MAGICPHELFANTRMDLGPCDKLHSTDVKLQYDLAVKEETFEGYEDLLERSLEYYVQEMDVKIRRGFGCLFLLF